MLVFLELGIKNVIHVQEVLALSRPLSLCRCLSLFLAVSRSLSRVISLSPSLSLSLSLSVARCLSLSLSLVISLSPPTPPPTGCIDIRGSPGDTTRMRCRHNKVKVYLHLQDISNVSDIVRVLHKTPDFRQKRACPARSRVC